MGTRLFVGNLAYSVTEQDLRDLFGSESIDVRSVRDLGSERYRTLGRLERKIRNARFDELAAAWIRAMAMNDREAVRAIGRQIDGEWLDATGAQRSEVRAHLAQYERAPILYGTPDATSGIGGGTGGPLVPLPLAQLIIAARNREAVGRTLFQRFESNAATLRVPTTGVATAAMACVLIDHALLQRAQCGRT